MSALRRGTGIFPLPAVAAPLATKSRSPRLLQRTRRAFEANRLANSAGAALNKLHCSLSYPNVSSLNSNPSSTPTPLFAQWPTFNCRLSVSLANAMPHRHFLAGGSNRALATPLTRSPATLLPHHTRTPLTPSPCRPSLSPCQLNLVASNSSTFSPRISPRYTPTPTRIFLCPRMCWSPQRRLFW